MLVNINVHYTRDWQKTDFKIESDVQKYNHKRKKGKGKMEMKSCFNFTLVSLIGPFYCSVQKLSEARVIIGERKQESVPEI